LPNQIASYSTAIWLESSLNLTFSNLKLIKFGTAIIGDDFHVFRSTFNLFRSKVRLGQGQGRVSYYHPPLRMTASSCHAALLLAGNGVLVRG